MADHVKRHARQSIAQEAQSRIEIQRSPIPPAVATTAKARRPRRPDAPVVIGEDVEAMAGEELRVAMIERNLTIQSR
ncbi:hypothetical protein GCM10011504_54690 [Siccirubricoccus deserti]|nr:hypothetical protein GCM10011504_54690 [Siccirubricoccus deserti]